MAREVSQGQGQLRDFAPLDSPYTLLLNCCLRYGLLLISCLLLYVIAIRDLPPFPDRAWQWIFHGFAVPPPRRRPSPRLFPPFPTPPRAERCARSPSRASLAILYIVHPEAGFS